MRRPSVLAALVAGLVAGLVVGLAFAISFGLLFETELPEVLPIAPLDEPFYPFASGMIAVVILVPVLPLRAVGVSWGRAIVIGPLAQLTAFALAFSSLLPLGEFGVLMAPTLAVALGAVAGLLLAARPPAATVLLTASVAAGLGIVTYPLVVGLDAGTWWFLAIVAAGPALSWTALVGAAAVALKRQARAFRPRAIPVGIASTALAVILGALWVLVLAGLELADHRQERDALARARAFRGFPVYWAGASYDGAALEKIFTGPGMRFAFVYESGVVLYTHAGAPLIPREPPGYGAPGRWVRPYECLRVRGAPVSFHGGSLELFTGDVAVVTYGGGRDVGLRALRALEGVNVPTTERLPPPDPDRPLPCPRRPA